MIFAFWRRFLPADLRSRWSLDVHERAFVDAASQYTANINATEGPRLLLQMPSDYFCLSLFCAAILRLRPTTIDGLWHQNIMSAPRDENWQWVRSLLRRALNYFDQLKWRRLYAALGTKRFHSLKVYWLAGLYHWFLAHRIWSSLSSKEELLNLDLRGTHSGDLIYDTYLRYRVQPTVDLRDPYLRTVIAEALNAQTAMRRLISKHKFDVFLTSYTSYVQHGIPAREAVQLGVKVYSAGNVSQYFKQLHPDDVLHTPSHWHYGALFEQLSDPETASELAQGQLKTRFKGSVDPATSYMKASAYADNGEPMPEGIEGVVFLHDFFDSPHCYRNMLFVDFFEWVHFTLNVIQKNGLPFAVKPHPNQRSESNRVVLELQRQYPDIQWLPSTMSNKTILQSGIKCGISVYGTILHELAYHSIVAIACGDHPHISFDIAVTPTSIDEYAKYLIGYREIEAGSDLQWKVSAFYYMHNLYVNEGLALNLAGLKLREIGPSDSRGLDTFLKMLPDLTSAAQDRSGSD